MNENTIAMPNATGILKKMILEKINSLRVAFLPARVFIQRHEVWEGPENSIGKLETEKELLEGLRRDQQSLREQTKERFYKHYWGYLMAVAMRYVADKDTASIVVNDSFLKIFENLPGFQCEDKDNFHKALRGWMAKITVRTALNEVRKQTRRVGFTELTEANDHRAQVMMHDRFYNDTVSKLLSHLAPNQQKVFLLYEIEGFSHEEIAEMLGIAESSSRVYLVRAREKLKTLYSTIMA